jgi:hypothetical protein
MFLSRCRAAAIASFISCTLLLPSLALAGGGGGHSSSSSSHSSSSYSSPHSSSKSSSSGGSVHVQGHMTKNGTYVPSHERSKPDGDFSNNWSTKGNVNPYTGKPGTRVTPPSGHSGTSGSRSLPSSGSPTPSFLGSRGGLPSAGVASTKIDGSSITEPRGLQEAGIPAAGAGPNVGGATESPQTVTTRLPSSAAPNGAAPAKFTSKLANARALIKAGVLAPARKYLREIIDGAPGTSIAADAQRELDALAR